MFKLIPFQRLTHSIKPNYSNIRPLANIFSVALVRSKTTRSCADNPGPRCPKTRNDNVCSKVKRKSDKTPPKPRPKTSMWVEPECCKILYCDWEPRYDDMYWNASDKNKRKYQQTWVSCPEFKIVPRECEFDTVDPPPMEKRKRKEIGKISACGLKVKCLNLGGKCPRLAYKQCREARKNVKCQKNKTPKCCKKFCTPQPAYSECSRRIMRRYKKTQCNCNVTPMICEVLEALAAEQRRNKLNPSKECPC